MAMGCTQTDGDGLHRHRLMDMGCIDTDRHMDMGCTDTLMNMVCTDRQTYRHELYRHRLMDRVAQRFMDIGCTDTDRLTD